MSIRVAPCNWPLVYCGDGGEGPTGCSSLNGLDVALAELIEEAAVSYLWNWTKKQFGTCEISLRPCKEQCLQQWTTYRGRAGTNGNLPWTEGGMGPLNPALIRGVWWNLGCSGSCDTDQCSCTYVPTVNLPGPVDSVTEVWIDGVQLDADAYRVDNHSKLIRVDGGDWPACQDMLSDPTVPGTDSFMVVFDQGVPVPAGGQIAAGILACEMAKAACRDNSCKLPQRLQSITRQGVTMTVLDSFSDLYEHGATGLWLVDNWVASIIGTEQHAARATVASPDYRNYPRRTTS
jgi:hypothetical protein